MQYSFIFLVGFFIFGSTACSSSEQGVADMENKVSANDVKKEIISAEDQLIIDNYKKKINTEDLSDTEALEKVLKESLVEVNKIKNNYEREKLQLNIYSALSMYKEAYELNNKMLKDSFTIERLILQCDLVYISKRSKAEYEQCYARLAIEFRKELKGMRRSDPEYAYSEWGYLLFMYKSGHAEYQEKLKKMLDYAKDEQMKLTFENLYVLAVEQVESYKKLSQ
ncbi:hypothetical protein A6M14_07755 [Acinetobacter sp. Ac_877]|uniref:hypothetical protein n=1 Tax=Acinetobacter portensis TaxID=1839785 RepID=UPI00128E288D|nr:hypothetical protein [Acinetobacter portensis]MPW41276.1 hypothetical protein [Acinetobacter portensis]